MIVIPGRTRRVQRFALCTSTEIVGLLRAGFALQARLKDGTIANVAQVGYLLIFTPTAIAEDRLIVHETADIDNMATWNTKIPVRIVASSEEMATSREPL